MAIVLRGYDGSIYTIREADLLIITAEGYANRLILRVRSPNSGPTANTVLVDYSKDVLRRVTDIYWQTVQDIAGNPNHGTVFIDLEELAERMKEELAAGDSAEVEE